MIPSTAGCTSNMKTCRADVISRVGGRSIETTYLSVSEGIYCYLVGVKVEGEIIGEQY